MSKERQKKLEQLQDLVMDACIELLENDKDEKDPKKKLKLYDLNPVMAFLKNNNKVEDKNTGKGMHELINEAKDEPQQ